MQSWWKDVLFSENQDLFFVLLMVDFVFVVNVGTGCTCLAN